MQLFLERTVALFQKTDVLFLCKKDNCSFSERTIVLFQKHNGSFSGVTVVFFFRNDNCSASFQYLENLVVIGAGATRVLGLGGPPGTSRLTGEPLGRAS